MIGSSSTQLDVDDRTLAHLRVVMLAKLRRAESFALNWDHDTDDGAVASTIWIQPAIDLEFTFESDAPVRINKAWADRLMHTANSVRGLELLPEALIAPGVEDELSASALAT